MHPSHSAFPPVPSHHVWVASTQSIELTTPTSTMAPAEFSVLISRRNVSAPVASLMV
jgi:hypothetical protein